MFYTLFHLTYREKLDHVRFESIWQQMCKYELENLLTEIIFRVDLELLDKPVAYIQIGDFGVQQLLYFTKLETELE